MPTDWKPDYYALLGVGPEIACAELRLVWRRLANRWHPDHAGHSATATFQNISAAYKVLSDPAARAAYDRRRGTPQSLSTHSPTGTASRRKAPGVSLRSTNAITVFRDSCEYFVQLPDSIPCSNR